MSASVLNIIAPSGDLQVGGFPWQDQQTLQGIGINSLQSKILCRTHNSALANLDAEAAKFVEAIINVDKAPETLPYTSEFCGNTLELWLLKVICGTFVTNNLSNAPISDSLKEILVSGVWPEGCGMYSSPSTIPEIVSHDILLRAAFDSITKEIKWAEFRISGVYIYLVLRKPLKPEKFGIYRPRGLCFEIDKFAIRIGFQWAVPTTSSAIIFTKLGVTHELAPHQKGWYEK